MNLLNNDGIVYFYRKNAKKSMYFSRRIDLFLILSVLILLISPFVAGSVSKPAANKLTELSLSPRSVELFGMDLTETLLREFEEKNPDLRIILSGADSSSQTGADILIFDEGDFYSLAAGKALISLENYIDYETGELYAIPLVSFMDLLFYNIDLLKAAGFDRPPKTREEFLNYAKTVSSSKTSGAYGTAFSLSSMDRQAMPRDIFSWIWAAGGNFWQTEDKPVIDSRSIIADINFLGGLYREGVLAPMSFYTTGEQRLEEFAQGKIAMMVASTRAIPVLREKMGDGAFSITTIPGSGSAGKYSVSISNFYTGISADCAFPEEAWGFLEFLAERSPFLCEELKAVPGMVSDFFSGDYFKDDPFYSKARDIFDSSQIVYGFSGKPDAEEFEMAVREEMRIFFETNRSAQETAAAIQQRWDMFFLYR